MLSFVTEHPRVALRGLAFDWQEPSVARRVGQKVVIVGRSDENAHSQPLYGFSRVLRSYRVLRARDERLDGLDFLRLLRGKQFGHLRNPESP
jgi:hypothetical protein